METTKKIKRVNKDEPTGFDRFNRVSKGANAVLNIIFIIMSLLCVIPILLVVAISFSAEDSITEYGYRFIPKIFSLEGYTFSEHDAAESTGCLSVCNDRWHGSGCYADNSDGLCTFPSELQIKRFPYNGGIYPHGI